MNEATIGRNYAEALLTLARKGESGAVEEWGALLEAISVAMRENQTLRTFLESPKLAASHKIEILEKALGRRVPRLFLRYVETVIQKRRQMLIPAIATEFYEVVLASPLRTSPAGTTTLNTRYWSPPLTPLPRRRSFAPPDVPGRTFTSSRSPAIVGTSTFVPSTAVSEICAV